MVQTILARAVLEEKYDTLMYDDRTTCSYEGYFRLMIKNDAKLIDNGVLLIPNPATTSVNIRIVNQSDLISDIDVLNNIGEKIFYKININHKYLTLNTTLLVNGVYTVRIKTANGYFYSTKLIIIK